MIWKTDRMDLFDKPTPVKPAKVPSKVPSLGKGPVKHRLRKSKRKKYLPRVVLPIVTFRTSPELKLLIQEGAKLQRRSVTKFLEQLVVDWHQARGGE